MRRRVLGEDPGGLGYQKVCEREGGVRSWGRLEREPAFSLEGRASDERGHQIMESVDIYVLREIV